MQDSEAADLKQSHERAAAEEKKDLHDYMLRGNP